MVGRPDYASDVAVFHLREPGDAYMGSPQALEGSIDESTFGHLQALVGVIKLQGSRGANPFAFRLGFLLEEIVEYARAHLTDDLEGELDALVDAEYVLRGTVHLQGFDRRRADNDLVPFDEAWRRVHAANMGKVPSRGGKFVKPPGWTPPTHYDLVGPDNGPSRIEYEVRWCRRCGAQDEYPVEEAGPCTSGCGATV